MKFFYRIHKEKNGNSYLKIWKRENGKEIYVRSCGTAEKLNKKLERLEKQDVPNQKK